jgi:hypothetical protein
MHGKNVAKRWNSVLYSSYLQIIVRKQMAFIATYRRIAHRNAPFVYVTIKIMNNIWHVSRINVYGSAKQDKLDMQLPPALRLKAA